MNTFCGLLILARCTDAWRTQSHDQAKAWRENFVAHRSRTITRTFRRDVLDRSDSQCLMLSGWR